MKGPASNTLYVLSRIKVKCNFDIQCCTEISVQPLKRISHKYSTNSKTQPKMKKMLSVPCHSTFLSFHPFLISPFLTYCVTAPFPVMLCSQVLAFLLQLLLKLAHTLQHMKQQDAAQG